jgi:hypothetical protein
MKVLFWKSYVETFLSEYPVESSGEDCGDNSADTSNNNDAI